MSGGGIVTPPVALLRVSGYSSETAGEAGRALEIFLFGGIMEYYRDVNYQADDQVRPHCQNQTCSSQNQALTRHPQPGIPHIFRGTQAFQITSDAIERTVQYGNPPPPHKVTIHLLTPLFHADFELPYAHSLQPTNPSAMRPMARPAPSAASTMDPTIRNLLAHPVRGYNVRVGNGSALQQVPVDPSIRVQAA